MAKEIETESLGKVIEKSVSYKSGWGQGGGGDSGWWLLSKPVNQDQISIVLRIIITLLYSNLQVQILAFYYS